MHVAYVNRGVRPQVGLDGFGHFGIDVRTKITSRSCGKQRPPRRLQRFTCPPLHAGSRWRRVPANNRWRTTISVGAPTQRQRRQGMSFNVDGMVLPGKQRLKLHGDGRDLDVCDGVSRSAEWPANVGLSTWSQPTTRRRRCSKHMRCGASRLSISEAAFRPPSLVRRIQPYRDGTVIGEAYRHVGSEDPFFDRDIVCRQRVAKRFIECVRLVRYGGA